ncbi:alpha-ketoglutarate-dependent dioxygenase AlkB [Pseudoalteromonas luteoviolacea]|uniref:alpha-ketoglutarate-dependent dioxygenase AlkB family protein n=1 Tax=Pseudoalteromonas luteoviolacea TaxID=43657 RepID=UPI001B35A47E|nr:alpha-ketoglutarate-dependent dioxygenase AlkB [Pseudoalteromonas luteoviolacea]MBQ4813580.1 alpha-ketoglutarate-dependent dioxygenase AlkB [Pseudoalteromonas luteoviolacea]
MSKLNKECLPEGFQYFPHGISFDKSLALYDYLCGHLPWQQPEIRVYGKLHRIPRLQCFIADQNANYGYSGKQLDSCEWLPVLSSIRARLQQQYGQSFNALLLNWYRDGQDTMGWHSDDERELGNEPMIVSVSLGASRLFKIRDKVTRETYSILLETGSFLMMSGRSQHDFEHSLPKQAKVSQGRINLTFRTVG